MRGSRVGWALLALLAGCGQSPDRETPPANEVSAAQAPAPAPAAPVPSAQPDLPEGVSADRTPLDERPQPPQSAQGAATVVETYFALLADHKYGEAWRLWANDGQASGMSEQAFADSFANYARYYAEVYAPGAIEGAAGSLYVEVPAKVTGSLKDGTPIRLDGLMTLRRVNDVPGSTADQRKWHISASGLKPRPAGSVAGGTP